MGQDEAAQDPSWKMEKTKQNNTRPPQVALRWCQVSVSGGGGFSASLCSLRLV